MVTSLSPLRASETTGGVGLVLSGGGARGAYEVGVLRRLADEGVEVVAVSGTSIGALNGAVVAAAKSMVDASQKLEAVWLAVADRVTKTDGSAPMKAAMLAGRLIMSFASAQKAELLRAFAEMFRTGHRAKWAIARHNSDNPDDVWLSTLLGLDPTVFDSDHLEKLFGDQFSDDALEAGRPFYVSVMPSAGPLLDFVEALKGSLDLKVGRETVAMHVQRLPPAERRNAILASAALPFIFESREVAGTAYVDGGLTGFRDLLGNTPLQALHEANACAVAIVVHLSEGSLFDRSRYPNVAVVEVRPRRTTIRQNALRDLLSFDGASIRSWIEQGYEDCGHYLSQLRELAGIKAARRVVDSRLAEAQARMREARKED